MNHRGQARRRLLWAPCLLAGLAMIGLGAALLTGRPPHQHARAVPLVNVGEVPSSQASRGTPPGASSGTATGTPPPAGSRLVLSRLGVDAPIVSVAVHAGVMDVPMDPREVGWWSGGAAPGSGRGSVVIVGHINYAGVAGALGALPQARPGDVVEVREGGRTERYRMVAVRSYAKSRGLPAGAFSASGGPQLVLITCGGPFDSRTGNYEDNIVGYATPFSSR